MAKSSLTKKLVCVVTGAEVSGDGIVVRFAARRGHPSEVEDRIPLAPRGEMPTIYGIGRLLRILRAGRVPVPSDPYEWSSSPQEACVLVERCIGVLVHLQVRRRIERVLTLWTDSGVERVAGVMDFTEDAEGLSVTRRGGRAVLFISKRNLIRYEASAEEYWVVSSVEIPPRIRLQ